MAHELYRGSDPFPRVYSPPEPPKKPRRIRPVALLAAVAALAVLAGIGYAVVGLTGGGGAGRATATETRPATSPTQQASPSESASTSPSRLQTQQPTRQPSGQAPGLFTGAPAACATPDQATVIRLITGSRTVQKISRTDDPTCVISSANYSSSLVVETRVVPPAGAPDPVGSAKGLFAADFTAAKQGDGYEQTLSVGAQPGLGDEAFRWGKLDKGGPTAIVGQVEARTGNGLVIVTYSGSARHGESSGQAADRLLGDAEDVARQALASFRS